MRNKKKHTLKNQLHTCMRYGTAGRQLLFPVNPSGVEAWKNVQASGYYNDGRASLSNVFKVAMHGACMCVASVGLQFSFEMISGTHSMELAWIRNQKAQRRRKRVGGNACCINRLHPSPPSNPHTQLGAGGEGAREEKVDKQAARLVHVFLFLLLLFANDARHKPKYRCLCVNKDAPYPGIERLSYRGRLS